MSTYKCSDGTRVTQKEIEARMRKTKKTMLERQRMAIGYNVCTVCWRNDCKPLDCSHNVSVQQAKNTGRTELCWSHHNIAITGRECHKKKDGLTLQFKENEQ